MTMPTCNVCGKKWYGNPTSTICGACVAKKKQARLDIDNMTVHVLPDDRQRHLDKKPAISSKRQRRQEAKVGDNMEGALSRGARRRRNKHRFQ